MKVAQEQENDLNDNWEMSAWELVLLSRFCQNGEDLCAVIWRCLPKMPVDLANRHLVGCWVS